LYVIAGIILKKWRGHFPEADGKREEVLYHPRDYIIGFGTGATARVIFFKKRVVFF